MRALHDLVESGKVRYIGASSMRTWQFAEYNRVVEVNGWTPFVSMQNEYSLLYREEVRSIFALIYISPNQRFQEREMIPYCNARGVGIIPWGPLQAGNLAKPLSEQSTRRASGRNTYSEADTETIRRVEEVASKRGWTMAQVALAWMDSKVSSPIVGMSSPERLEANIITGKKLTEEEEKYLEEPCVFAPSQPVYAR